MFNNLIKQSVLADTHCHLHHHLFAGRMAEILHKSAAQGVEEIWLVSIDQASALQNIDLVEKYGNKFKGLKLRASGGFDMELVVPGSDIFNMQWFHLSPQDLVKRLEEFYKEIFGYAQSKDVKIDFIGEIGMDYYWLEKGLSNIDKSSEFITQKDYQHSAKLQKAMFEFQLDRAIKERLGVSIHSRGAERECIELVGRFTENYKGSVGIFHSFTGSSAQMRQIREMGFAVGINGISTYKSAQAIQQGIRRELKTALLNSKYADKYKTVDVDDWFEFERPGGMTSALTLKQKLEVLYSAGFVLETDAPYLIPANADRGKLLQVEGEHVNEPYTILNTLDNIFNF
jgi:Tat protein secretion system quality control protein TatD with DNase activity